MAHTTGDTSHAKDSAPENSSVLRSVSRALDILLLFKSERELGIREISRRLNMNPAATFRAASTLTEYGFLSQEEETRTYLLGPAISELGYAVGQSKGFNEVSLALMSRLRAVTGESVALNILENGRRLGLLTLDSPYALRVVLSVGTPIPITNGATDLVFRAFCSSSELEQINHEVVLASERPADNSHAPANELLSNLGEIPSEEDVLITRERGWGISHSKRTEGTLAFAAPVSLPYGLYAISVTGPLGRMSAIGEEKVGSMVSAHAGELALALRNIQPPSSILNSPVL